MTAMPRSEVSSSAQHLKLSSSLAGVVSQFSEVEEVSAAAIVNSLLELHGDSYAGGRGAKMRVSEDSSSPRRLVREWIGKIEELYDPPQIE